MGQKFVSILPHKTNSLDNELILKKTAAFDLGTFKVETNLIERSIVYKYPKKETISYTLEDIEDSNLLFPFVDQKSFVKLNLSKSDPTNYALYGSFKIKLENALNTIIETYPASLSITNSRNSGTVNNITNFVYNPFEDTSTFNISTLNIVNPLSLNYIKENLNVAEQRDLLLLYYQYEVYTNNKSYPILEFTGAENQFDKITLKVSGKPFNVGNNSVAFYIKPTSAYFTTFQNTLDDLELYLLDSFFYFDDYLTTDLGTELKYQYQFSWPKIDAFNLDVSTTNFTVFYDELLKYADKIDTEFSNLLYRKYTPKSFYNTYEDESLEQNSNIDELMQIYGFSFDEIYKRIEGAKLLHSVSFSESNNTPNNYLPDLLKVLGWNFGGYETNSPTLLKLLILTSNWVWKSKGTRAAIDYILSFVGIPKELIEFNEYVYVSKRPINVEKFNFYLSLLGTSLSLSDFPIDEEGYPVFPTETDSLWFQANGEQDNGQEFLNVFYNLMPVFTGSTVSYYQELTDYEKLFEQTFIYSSSTLDYDIARQSTLTLDICYTSTGQTVSDPLPETVYDECGCPIEVEDYSLEICSTPVDLYSGTCLDFFLDVWLICDYDLSGNPIATVNITPYNYMGAVTYVGTQPGEILTNNQDFTVYGIDSNGCVSETYSGTVICAVNICEDVEFSASIEYSCNVNELNQHIGKATIDNIIISGGTAPYVTNISVGDIVNHEEMVELVVTDANGCVSQTFTTLIDCPPDEEFVCENINFTLAYEVTYVNLDCQEIFGTCAVAESQAKLNYEVYNLPDGVDVDTVEVTVSAAPFLYGDPVTIIFTTPIGTTPSYYLDFAPDPPQLWLTTFNVTIVLSNGCQYSVTHADEIEYGVLGYSFSQNFILTPD